ncbi:hypothetical protein TIFTF001_006614 [Ficus carica]|uniref:CRC domain-containing protein n=1 Tax=Ficus carica TaxID=3494 RepID=A0AA87ZRL3_FICCA|nr:hypothetical protein TIFTF001_006614 [Ficus carica]
MRRRRGSYGVSRFRAKKLDFSTFQGLASATRSSLPDRFQSPVEPNLELQLSPPSPFSTNRAIDSSTSQPQIYAGDFNGTPKHHKQCGCKRTKCLKLYCECFASGIFCSGCKCVDCHNIIENVSARHAAVEHILERKRNALRPKITNSSPITQGSPSVAKQKKGCQCKKTCCLKGYCECFQANLFCSENCKCLDCKNYEGTEKNTPTQACQVNPLTASGEPSAFIPRRYRSLLANIISPDSIRHFCSKLVAATDASKMHEVTMLGHQDHKTDNYSEQERLALTNFRDFLKKIIACGNMRVGSSTVSGRERVRSRILKRKTEHSHVKCTMFR